MNNISHPISDTGPYPARAGLPARAGISFKPQHFDALLADDDRPAFIEVHAENYMGAGGPPHARLSALRECLPLSIHGVGLSIGGEAPLDQAHLARLQHLIARYQPAAFSEHLAWSSHGGHFFNDLLPLCYDNASLNRVCAHIDQIQERLGRQMSLENPSTYLELAGGSYNEPQFLSEVVRRTGCALLLDVNNVYVTCHNNGHDPAHYLLALPLSQVRQIHLAGHMQESDLNGHRLLIDDHGAPVCTAVWVLYRNLLTQTGPLPTLIEWDTRVPSYAVLRDQARQAQSLLNEAGATTPAAA